MSLKCFLIEESISEHILIKICVRPISVDPLLIKLLLLYFRTHKTSILFCWAPMKPWEILTN